MWDVFRYAYRKNVQDINEFKYELYQPFCPKWTIFQQEVKTNSEIRNFLIGNTFLPLALVRLRNLQIFFIINMLNFILP